MKTNRKAVKQAITVTPLSHPLIGSILCGVSTLRCYSEVLFVKASETKHSKRNCRRARVTLLQFQGSLPSHLNEWSGYKTMNPQHFTDAYGFRFRQAVGMRLDNIHLPVYQNWCDSTRKWGTVNNVNLIGVGCYKSHGSKRKNSQKGRKVKGIPIGKRYITTRSRHVCSVPTSVAT